MVKILSFKQIIKKIDLFGNSVGFNINREEKVKTEIGGLISLIIYLASLVVVTFKINEFLWSNRPNVYIDNVFRNSSIIDKITTNSFNTSIFIENIFNTSTDPYKLIASDLINYSRKEINKFESFERIGNWTYCDQSKISNNPSFKNQFKMTNPKSNYCINFNSNEFYAGGDYFKGIPIKSVSSYFVIDLCTKLSETICNNITKLRYHNSNNFEKLFLSYENHYINFTNSRGFIKYFTFEEIDLDYSMDYYFTAIYTKNTIKTDQNILLNIFPKVEEVFYTVKYIKNTQPRKSKNFNFFTINFDYKYDLFENVIHRTYTKFDTVLACIFSLYGSLFTIGKYLSLIFTFGYPESLLIKQFYNISNTQKINENVNLVKLNNIQLSNMPNNIVSNDELNNNDDISLIDKKIINRKHIKRSIFLYFCPLLTLNSKQEFEIELLKLDLDVVFIIKRLIEYENFKEDIYKKLNKKEIITKKRIINEADKESYIDDINNSFDLI